jgi:hypothetical protein
MPIVANGVSMVNFPGPNTDRILPKTIVRIFSAVFFFGEINSLLGRKGYASVPKTTTVSPSSPALKISPGTRI